MVKGLKSKRKEADSEIEEIFARMSQSIEEHGLTHTGASVLAGQNPRWFGQMVHSGHLSNMMAVRRLAIELGVSVDYWFGLKVKKKRK